jgi:cytochrome c oxidase assembly protein subunit 15
MANFRRFAFITTVATYLLIFIGGLVRVSGAGLGCPDWPKCFGRWIPPVNVSQLPSDIDPLTFNFTLAWIEYFNRLTGVTIGILILITAILAIKYFRKVKKILYPSIAAALLVAYQGWHGGQVVASELEPIIVSVHMVLALIIVSLLIYVTQKAYYLGRIEEGVAIKGYGGGGLAVGILWMVTIFQILIGTQVRSSVETLQKKYPLLSDSAILGMIGSVNFIHTVLGVIVVVFGIYLGFKISRQKGISNLVKQCARGIIILTAAQLVIGILLVVVGIPQLLQVFHLWAAAVSVGLLLVLFSAARPAEGGKYAAGG